MGGRPAAGLGRGVTARGPGQRRGRVGWPAGGRDKWCGTRVGTGHALLPTRNRRSSGHQTGHSVSGTVSVACTRAPQPGPHTSHKTVLTVLPTAGVARGAGGGWACGGHTYTRQGAGEGSKGGGRWGTPAPRAVQGDLTKLSGAPIADWEVGSVSECRYRRAPQQMREQRQCSEEGLQERGRCPGTALPWGGGLREGPARHLDTRTMPLLVCTKPQPKSALL